MKIHSLPEAHIRTQAATGNVDTREPYELGTHWRRHLQLLKLDSFTSLNPWKETNLGELRKNTLPTAT